MWFTVEEKVICVEILYYFWYNSFVYLNHIYGLLFYIFRWFINETSPHNMKFSGTVQPNAETRVLILNDSSLITLTNKNLFPDLHFTWVFAWFQLNKIFFYCFPLALSFFKNALKLKTKNNTHLLLPILIDFRLV